VSYLLKYVAKLEPVFDLSLLASLPQATKDYLRMEEGRHIQGRIMSSCEVGARLLGYVHVSNGTKDGVTFLNTESALDRTRVVNIAAVEARAGQIAADRPRGELIAAWSACPSSLSLCGAKASSRRGERSEVT